MLHPENFGTRELQICLVSTFYFPTPIFAEEAALKNVKITKQLLIRMLGQFLHFVTCELMSKWHSVSRDW